MNTSVEAARQSTMTRSVRSSARNMSSSERDWARLMNSASRVKPFQRRVFVVAVTGDKGNGFIFQILNQIDGEKTFADAAFAVQDEVELLFHSSPGLANSMRAMRGPPSPAGLGDKFAGTALKRLSRKTACAALVIGAGAPHCR